MRIESYADAIIEVRGCLVVRIRILDIFLSCHIFWIWIYLQSFLIYSLQLTFLFLFEEITSVCAYHRLLVPLSEPLVPDCSCSVSNPSFKLVYGCKWVNMFRPWGFGCCSEMLCEHLVCSVEVAAEAQRFFVLSSAVHTLGGRARSWF